ncbi:MAG: hypothetical protein MUE85_12545 [Microscillaceae bacterium]|jgi:hypothetical protein|nr:hypothetical protein [Microscillaceae bacterium]
MKNKVLLVLMSLIWTIMVMMSCTYQVAEDLLPPPSLIPENNEKYGRRWFYYAQVNKSGDYFRRMFIDSVSAQIVKNTGNIPENALFAMETWFGAGQSTVYIRQKKLQWQSGSFSPNNPDYAVSLNLSCNNCHNRASVSDQTFTKPLLVKALQRNQVQVIECNQSSFNPCDLSVYQGN